MVGGALVDSSVDVGRLSVDDDCVVGSVVGSSGVVVVGMGSKVPELVPI